MSVDVTEILRTNRVRREFQSGKEKRIAVDDVSLRIKSGEFTTIFGPSGSGKSTLLGIMGGLDRDFQGEVWVHDKNLKTMSDRQLSRFRGEQVGFVFQAFHLLDHLSVIDNVKIPFLFSPHRHGHEAAMQALQLVGLADRLNDATSNLSGGQRQRVAIARAIAHKPSLLLCDEPTGNLDDQTARQVIDIFISLNRERGATVICATHDERMGRASDRIFRMQDGCISLEKEEDCALA